MEEKSGFVVSEKELFPVIEEILESGKEVRLTVSGNSMWPFIRHNRDSVILIPCDASSLKKGDIILFEAAKDHYILHRITKVKKDGYITTGDGNLHRDGFIAQKAVRAKVNLVYREGRVIDCGKWYWKAVFRLWMAAFPVRRYLKKALICVKKGIGR